MPPPSSKRAIDGLFALFRLRRKLRIMYIMLNLMHKKKAVFLDSHPLKRNCVTECRRRELAELMSVVFYARARTQEDPKITKNFFRGSR
jgi:hypothetical protein